MNRGQNALRERVRVGFFLSDLRDAALFLNREQIGRETTDSARHRHNSERRAQILPTSPATDERHIEPLPVNSRAPSESSWFSI
jgi:hypothetical protein